MVKMLSSVVYLRVTFFKTCINFACILGVFLYQDIERKMTQWRAQHMKAAMEQKAAQEAAQQAELAEREAHRESRERAIPRR